MESAINIPIQMISACNTTGEIIPLKFKFENDEHMIKTVNILDTICCKEINYSGIKALLFTCKAVIGDKENLFELKYTFLTHTWVLFRILY